MAEQGGNDHERGISRRDLIKRSAALGGTLIWAAPVIQSIATPAHAASPVFACCSCARGHVGSPKRTACATDSFDDQSCIEFCRSKIPNFNPATNRDRYYLRRSNRPFSCSHDTKLEDRCVGG